LGFKDAALTHLAFLEDYGYEVVVATETYVRFERDHFFVIAFHGRSSYELVIEIGYQSPVEGNAVDRKYATQYLAAVLGGSALETHPRRTAVTAGEVRKFTRELALWLEQHAGPVLSGDESAFKRLEAEVTRQSQEYLDAIQAERLRSRATESWKSKNYHDVVLAYEEIQSELPTVELRRHEAERLRFAQRHTTDS
jgi:hypothetical protein